VHYTIEGKTMVKIVVIEDNLSSMKLASFLLNSAGYEVLEASNAKNGLELIRSQMPALVLMDVQLPGMNGLDATRQLKSDPNLTHIKVIALTAYAMSGDEEIMRAAGCDGYISKPIHRLDFLELVNRMLD
jgi:two-component system cell cycle response regulator DivK